MTQINLGRGCNIDLKKLLKGRLLLSAMSGGGKTWTLRRLLEQSHGQVQQIVFDLEGEFSTLREKFDYILVGKGKGVDIQISIQVAETLAKKILEMNVSTIIDLYELKHHERILFVKRFLEAMIDAPKELWHPVLVVIDETHIFAPQDSKCESKGSVIDMATRGRKRGFALVAATQRPSQLEKDVSSQCTNKLIGRFSEDIDMKRAGYELGFVSREDILSLRSLQDGEFYAIGIAISQTIKKVKIGSVQTTHYEAGTGKIIAPPKPTAKIKAVLSKLIDLPKEAEIELKTIQDFKSEIFRLKTELRAKEKIKTQPDGKQIEQAETRGYNTGLFEASNQYRQAGINQSKSFQDREKKYQELITNQSKQMQDMLQRFKKLNEISLFAVQQFNDFKDLQQKLREAKVPEHIVSTIKERMDVSKGKNYTITEAKKKLFPKEPRLELHSIDKLHEDGSEENILDAKRLKQACPKTIYHFLYSNQDREFSKAQISIMTGYSLKSSGFVNSISVLNVAGLILSKNKKISVNKGNIVFARGVYGDLLEETIEYDKENILNILNECPRKILQFLYKNPEQIDKEQLAIETGYSLQSSGFVNAISKLNVMGLIQKDGSNISLSKDAEELI